ncbi:FadR/GntR family transcriptional regulator [Nocardioides sp. L-11A]|uniref:FadR/GntR family transcriptional regulator n=1 Tax=Nocardioides sp. L-11A TaxID=3043848 RepID=UPI00249C8749|nr:FCD domain-containing protein [Nocardioides sp. L-11A]
MAATPGPESVRSARAFELAVESVIDYIERSRVSVGSRLPGVAELAEALDVSKPTVRQALAALQESGMLAVRRGGGAGVYLISELAPVFVISSDVLHEEQIVEALTARRVIEGAVTLHALQVATDQDLAEIDRSVALMVEHVDDPVLGARAHAKFHRAVARASQSRQLVDATHAINRLLAPVRATYPPAGKDDRTTLVVHRRQAEVMRDRDAEALGVVMDEHFRQLEDVVAARRGVSWADLWGPAGPPTGLRLAL